MIQYLVAVIIFTLLAYNQCKRLKIESNQNVKIEQIIDQNGIENIMETLETDESFKKSSIKFDKLLSEIIKKDNEEKML